MTPGRSKKMDTGYTSPNRIRFVRGGKDYFDQLLDIIAKATRFIHLQTYIYLNDETGRMVADALKEAASRKVDVYLLADGYASQELPSPFREELVAAGIQFRFFEPVFKSKYYYFGRRLHHKMVVIDGRYALVGGINISNNYNDLPGHPAWLDFALFVEGSVVQQLCILCWKTWKSFPPRMGLTPCEKFKLNFDIEPSQDRLVRMRRNDWVRRKNEVSKSYQEIFRQAKTEVVLLSSYFLPGKEFRRILVGCLQRGVRIKLVLAGISDVTVAKAAERHMYLWLLKNRIQIFEYQRNVLHAKLAICDESWMTIGSYNFNNISAHASIELNLDVNDTEFTRAVKGQVLSIIRDDCTEVLEAPFSHQNHLFHRLWRGFCYQLVLLLLYLFTFYFKQRE